MLTNLEMEHITSKMQYYGKCNKPINVTLHHFLMSKMFKTDRADLKIEYSNQRLQQMFEYRDRDYKKML